MSATREYAVIRARTGSGNPAAVHLIDADDLKEFPNIADYFPAGTRDVQEVGRHAGDVLVDGRQATGGDEGQHRMHGWLLDGRLV